MSVAGFLDGSVRGFEAAVAGSVWISWFFVKLGTRF
jgi:hypothetical protein